MILNDRLSEWAEANNRGDVLSLLSGNQVEKAVDVVSGETQGNKSMTSGFTSFSPVTLLVLAGLGFLMMKG